ncbi:outer membrane beta-barrel protein [Rhizobacter sp. OV335]|uniref:outer membrane beta-barrel protein n=1 Tax=Rhizobacter sp. OV335 TaxID=1500264 RepID=UPI00090FB6F0|nr:outer membrane beta-barrel protein [Rhizobacter sp. OV335]SHN14662.1 OmpA-like transmembrane domain-containing protein [Rhizobacter sp. OV335]
MNQRLRVSIGIAAVFVSSTALAQSGEHGYIGLNGGRAEYNTDCGVQASCDNASGAWKVYAGAAVNEWLGIELGYVDMRHADRAGGSAKARGVNLSLIGQVPLGDMFHIYGKLGTTYGRTDVSAAAGQPVATGDDKGFGATGAVGAAVDFGRNWTLALEWERQQFRFVGGRQDVDLTSLGLIYRY